MRCTLGTYSPSTNIMENDLMRVIFKIGTVLVISVNVYIDEVIENQIQIDDKEVRRKMFHLITLQPPPIVYFCSLMLVRKSA